MDPILLNSISVFLVQIGSRFLTLDFTDAQKKLVQHPWVQSIILFAMFYVSTRNLLISFALIIFYNICLYFLLNENSSYNIYTRKWLKEEGFTSSLQDKTNVYYKNMAALN